jgi:hypothetical protein
MIKQIASLKIATIAAIAAAALAVAGSVASARERIVESPWSNTALKGAPNGQTAAQTGWDSLNPDPFLSGPNPDFCISCEWPEGNPTYHGGNG